ncbi:MAG: putative metal-binding motif-containing protein [Alphaproteobacteria bacterium]|nr:putative metal-binding motif-containing protein [Alphaproteobacteria bacterium]
MRLLPLAVLAVFGCTNKDIATDDTTIGGDDSGGVVDADGDGYAAEGDCDDEDAAINPGAAEVCDGVDNNCDGQVDEGVTTTWYADNDGDGYGDSAAATEACEAPTGTVAVGGDCDDGDAAYNPGAAENDCADPNDYNCDGSVGYADNDGDGYAACEECDDSEAAVNPAATEVCDEVDNNCDGQIDEGVTTTYYADADADGYGDAAAPLEACAQPEGYSESATDCDDAVAAINPAATEVCNDLDDDCDGLTDTADDSLDWSTAGIWYIDDDGDGYGDAAVSTCNQPSGTVEVSGDCDDSDSAINPDADEICNGVDDDCDGLTDDDDGDLDTSTASAWYADADSDGYGDASTSSLACDRPSGMVSDDTDCDDADPDLNPGEPELCDFVDQDCDNVADEGLPDTDSSGLADCKEVAVVPSAGFQANAANYTCDSQDPVDRELQQIEDHLTDMGLGMVRINEDSSAGVSYSDFSAYGAVIYHNGGWSNAAHANTEQALADAEAAGMPIFLIGDDVAYQVSNTSGATGNSTMYDISRVASFSSNNSGRGQTVNVVSSASSHPVLSGSYGTVGSFTYVADLDALTLAGADETLLMETASGEEVVWVAESSAGQRTVVMQPSIHNSHDCPTSDAAGLAELEVLFQNAVAWAMDW